MNTNLLLQAGRLENESNQTVILAVNSGLRNRWRQLCRDNLSLPKPTRRNALIVLSGPIRDCYETL
jgi:hypothetical protein